MNVAHVGTVDVHPCPQAVLFLFCRVFFHGGEDVDIPVCVVLEPEVLVMLVTFLHVDRGVQAQLCIPDLFGMRLAFHNLQAGAQGCLVQGGAGLADAAAVTFHIVSVCDFLRGIEAPFRRPVSHDGIETEGFARRKFIPVHEVAQGVADIVVPVLGGAGVDFRGG